MSDKVMVGCKLPNGIVLHLHDYDAKTKRTVLRAESEVELNGFATHFGRTPDHDVRGGFGLTLVDADFWGEWVKLNKDFPPYKNGLIFAQESNEAAQAEAVMRSGDVRSGLEALSQKPGDDPRVPNQLEPAERPVH